MNYSFELTKTKSRQRNIREQAIEYIRKVLLNRGSGYELCDPAEYEEEFQDDSVVHKEGYPKMFMFMEQGVAAEEYPVVLIDILPNSKLVFTGISVNDADDEIKIGEDEMITECLCEIADLVQHLENE
jgi:hypothetical protein